MKLKTLVKEMTIAALMVLVYFAAVRPLRTAVNTYVVSAAVGGGGEAYSVSLEGVVTKITIPGDGEPYDIAWRPPFGFFFLAASIAFVFMGVDRKHYGWLALLHLVILLIGLLLLFIGSFGLSAAFLFAGFIVTYVSPALTLIYPVFLRVRDQGLRIRD